MMCNQNKNITGLIDESKGLARSAKILLATKIGGAMAIQKLWVKWTVGSCGPVGTSIILVTFRHISIFNIFISKILHCVLYLMK